MARSYLPNTDRIVIPVAFSITGTFSLSAWINPTIASFQTNGGAILFGFTAATNVVGWGIRDTTGKVFLSWSGVADVFNSTNTVTTGVWSNVVTTFDGTNWANYINGGSTETGTNSAHTFVAGRLAIGSYVDVTTNTWVGSLADVAVWNVLLTAGEAKSLSQGARPTTVRPKALTGYWPLTGLQSPEPDYSGVNNAGVVTGTANASGPPLMQFTPRWPMGAILPTSGSAPTTVFRRTLSPIGTRTGSRQVHGSP